MPMLMTEIEQGQKAALNLDLNPYRAQAELDRIPIETQRLQQTLETGKTNQATAALQLKTLLGEEQSNTQFKTAVEQLVKSGEFDTKTMPISEQNLKLANLAYGQGNFDLGRKFTADGERATQHEAQAETNASKIEQRKLSTLGTMVKLLSPDGSNLDAAIDDALKAKLLQPQQLEGLRQQGRQALANGPGAYAAWQTDLTTKLRTYEEQRLVLEQARLDAKILADEKKDILATRRFEAILSQRGAARTSGDDRAAVRLDTTMLTSARNQIERIEDNIQAIDRDLMKLPKVTYETGFFGGTKIDEQGNQTPNADPDRELRAELTGRRAALRKRLQTYKEEEARALRNLRKDGGTDEAPPEPAAKATPSAAAPIVAAPAAAIDHPTRREGSVGTMIQPPLPYTEGQNPQPNTLYKDKEGKTFYWGTNKKGEPNKYIKDVSPDKDKGDRADDQTIIQRVEGAGYVYDSPNYFYRLNPDNSISIADRDQKNKNRASSKFTPLIPPPTSDRTSGGAAAPSNNSGGRLTSAQQQDAISKANAAIARGADPVKVRQRLREAGISLKD